MHTFYANDTEGCVKCYREDAPLNAEWIVSSDEEFVLNELAHVGSVSVYFKVTAEVYEAVLEVYNIYH